MYDQHFHVEGRFLGSVVRSHVIVHGERQPAYSYAYFCPDCGELWAKCPVTDENGFVNKWQIQGGHCRLHPGPSQFTVAGSLLLAWEPEYSALLLSCPDVVRWEYQRHMEYYDRVFSQEKGT